MLSSHPIINSRYHDCANGDRSIAVNDDKQSTRETVPREPSIFTNAPFGNLILDILGLNSSP